MAEVVVPGRKILGEINPNKREKYCNTTTKVVQKAINVEKANVEKPFLKTDGKETRECNKELHVFNHLCKIRTSGSHDWTFGDFDFICNLGAGGTATVFLAREKHSGYYVALKVQEADEYAECEIDIHKLLKHDCIVKMFGHFSSDEQFGPKLPTTCFDSEVDDDDGDSYGEYEEDLPEDGCNKRMVMILEYCKGGSLFDAFCRGAGGHLSEPQAAAFLQDALDALEYIHEELDIIHCDCKTANFLVQHGDDKQPRLKLCDFGMAVPSNGKTIVGGSPVYMSTEHLQSWKHLTDDFDHRVDIYSLGVILYEILAGYLPYEVLHDNDDADDLLEILELDGLKTPILDLRGLDNPCSEDPIFIPAPIFPPHISAEAQNLISRLMAPTRQDRISITDAKNHPWLKKFL